MKIAFNKAIKVQLQKLGIAVVYLIGSRAAGTARINSDFDFAVVLKNSEKSLKNEKKIYEKLYDIFSKSLPKIKTRLLYPDNIINIDIIFLQTAPLYYAIAARDNGKVLFEISEDFRRRFEEYATLEYADFEPFQKEQERATLAMI